MSTTEESAIAAPVLPVADPAPLGLAGFALTTFLLSAFNAHLTRGGGAGWLPYALAYGGIAQLLAGMWEFRNRNVFGATAFGTYGGFWIGLAIWVLVVAETGPASGVGALVYAAKTGKDLGWILLAFAIFNTYMLLWSTQLNVAVFGVFLTLEATEIILFIGFFANSSGFHKFGGYLGLLTALVAWYASAAGVLNGMKGKPVVPVGGPLFRLGG